MNSQELRALQEAYNQVYELDESAIGDRARNAVADQRLDAAQRDTQQSVNKLAKREKVTRASAHIAAKKVEGDVRKSSSYGPQRPKPGTTGAYRITDSYEYDLYDIILSHLLDEGYAETLEQAEAIMVNMSEDWRESIFENVSSGKGRVTRYVQSKPTGPVTNRELDVSRQKRMDAENDRIKKIGDEAHAAATSKGLSFAEAEFRRKRAELRARKNS